MSDILAEKLHGKNTGWPYGDGKMEKQGVG